MDEQMAAEQGGGDQASQVAELFQNVGQGIQMIGQYVQQTVPDALPMIQGILEQYDQLIQVVGQARQGGAQPQGAQPGPQETGGRPAQQAM